MQGPHYGGPAGLPGSRAPFPSEVTCVPYFSGDGSDSHDARHWLDMLEEYALMWNWSEEARVRVARTRMIGPAHHWMSSLPRNISWVELEGEFLRRFGERTEAALSRLAACRQEQGEPVHAYADRFRRDMHLAGRVEDAALRYQFIAGLQRRLKHEVQRQHSNVRNLADIVNIAKHWEDCYEEERRHPEGQIRSSGGGAGPYVPPQLRDASSQPRRDPWRPNYRPSYENNSNNARGGYRPPGFNPQQRRPAYQPDSRPDNRPYNNNPNPHYPPRDSGPTPPINPGQHTRDAPRERAQGSTAAIDEVTRAMERLQLTMSELQRGQRAAGYPGAYYAEESLGEINTFEDTSTNNAFNSVFDQWIALCSKFQNWSTSSRTDPQQTNELIQEFKRFNEELLNTQHQSAGGQDMLTHPGADHHGRLFQRNSNDPKKTPATLTTTSTSPKHETSMGQNTDMNLKSNKQDTLQSASQSPNNKPNTPETIVPTRAPADNKTTELTIMDFMSDAEDEADWDTHQELSMAEDMYLGKRAADDVEPAHRMPAKRTAFTANPPMNKRPPVAEPRSGPDGNTLPRAPDLRTPPVGQARKPFQVPRPDSPRPPAPYRPGHPPAPGHGSGLQADRDPARRADPIPTLAAEELAESKGREMALKACRSLTVDAVKEDSLVVSAAKICAAGVLLGNQRLISLGKDSAKRVHGFDKKVQQSALNTLFAGPINPIGAQANLRIPAGKKSKGAFMNSRAHDAIYQDMEANETPGDNEGEGARIKVSTCKTLIRLGTANSPAWYETYAIVDTGASQSAITLDTVRRMGLTKYIDSSQKSYFYNADGRKSETAGLLKDFPVTIGKLTTKVTFSVTNALSYDVLLGNDFLMAIGAVIDLRAKELKYDIQKDLEGKVDVLCYSKQPEAVTCNCMEEDDCPDINDIFWQCSGQDIIEKASDSIDDIDPRSINADEIIEEIMAEIEKEDMDTKAFVDIGTANVEKPYELPIWPIPTGFNWNAPLQTWGWSPHYQEYDRDWVADMAAAYIPRLNDNKGNVLDWVCDHEALQWLAVFKAIQSWGHDNLDNIPGCVKTLAHMLQVNELVIKQKLTYWRTSTAKYVADKLVEKEVEFGTVASHEEIQQLAQDILGQGEQALEQVKALREVVRDTMQEATQALSTGQERPGLFYKHPRPASAEPTHHPGDTYLPPLPWKIGIPWIADSCLGSKRWFTIPHEMWIKANQLQPLPRVDEKVAPKQLQIPTMEVLAERKDIFPLEEAYMIEDIVETSVINEWDKVAPLLPNQEAKEWILVVKALREWGLHMVEDSGHQGLQVLAYMAGTSAECIKQKVQLWEETVAEGLASAILKEVNVELDKGDIRDICDYCAVPFWKVKQQVHRKRVLLVQRATKDKQATQDRVLESEQCMNVCDHISAAGPTQPGISEAQERSYLPPISPKEWLWLEEEQKNVIKTTHGCPVSILMQRLGLEALPTFSPNTKVALQMPPKECSVFSPKWVEHMADKFIPATKKCLKEVTPMIGGQEEFVWLVVLKAIQEWGYDLLLKNLAATLLLAKLLGTPLGNVEGKIRVWRDLSALYVVNHVFLAKREITPPSSEDLYDLKGKCQVYLADFFTVMVELCEERQAHMEAQARGLPCRQDDDVACLPLGEDDRMTENHGDAEMQPIYADSVMDYPHYDLDIASRCSLHENADARSIVDSICYLGALEADRDSYGSEDTSSAYEETEETDSSDIVGSTEDLDWDEEETGWIEPDDPAYLYEHERVYVGSSLEPWHHSDGEDDNEELSRIYTIESTREEPVEVGYPLYNSGELPPLANPGPSLTCDDIKLGKDLTPEQRQALRNVLWENADAFAFIPEQLGRCNVAVFDVRLKPGAVPVAQPYHRTPFKHRDAFRKEIDRMLELGLLRPSSSPWASPVVLVPKKDGSLRVTFDYRRGPNTWLEKDEYPLPRLDEILALLGEAKYLCAVDATKGFLQVPCTEEASRVCAVTTPFGLFEPTVMTMGVKTAPPTWQRAMNIGLAEHMGKRVFCYMDDAIIFAPTFEELLENVRLVLGAFRKMGIRLSPAKCQFGVRSLKFLGHIISPEGIQPDQGILEAIETYPPPREKVHVQRFLGLTNWLRKYVRNYARIAAPLSKLTGNEPFKFEEEERQAFHQLKHALKNPPILRHPDMARPFVLKTDACRLGLGGILAQRDPETGHEYVVRYGSRKTTTAERNYSATDLECAAVIHFIRKWHVFLAGGHFTIVTDHMALKYLMTTSDLTGRLARWAIRLQEYEFDIEYRPGKKHGDVDALSRAVGQEEEQRENSLPQAGKKNNDEPGSQVCQSGTSPQCSTSPDITSPDISQENLAAGQAVTRVAWTPRRDDPPTQTLDKLQLTCCYTTTRQPVPLRQSNRPVVASTSCPTSDGAILMMAPEPQPEGEAAAGNEVRTATLAGEASVDINGAVEVKKRQPLRIAIEGLIGAGKSSVLAMLSRDQELSAKWSLIPEPVEIWDADGSLSRFYETRARPSSDALRWEAAVRLQKKVIESYLDMTPLQDRTIMERGPWSSLSVFTKLADLPPTLEAQVYETAAADSRLQRSIPHVIIYVDTPVHTCLQRIQNRGVACEKSVDVTYLQDLEGRYLEALHEYVGKTFYVDGTLPKEQLLSQVKEIIAGVEGSWEDQEQAEVLLCMPKVPETIAPQHEYEMVRYEALQARDETGHKPCSDWTPNLLPGGSMLSALREKGADTPAPGTILHYPVNLEVDTETCVLFQNGPGVLQFSRKFEQVFGEHYGYLPSTYDRVDNFAVLNVMTFLGFEESVGPTSVPAFAILPRRGLPGLRIRRLTCGSELVEINPELYALMRAPSNALYQAEPDQTLTAYRQEGSTLAQRLRIVTSAEDILLPPLNTSSQKDTSTKSGHSSEGTSNKEPSSPYAESVPHIFLYSDASGDPDHNANSTDQGWTETEEDSGPSIPEDLPCQICGEPDDWPHMVLCSTCSKGYHVYCIGLKGIPSGAWDCPTCRKEGKKPMKIDKPHDEKRENSTITWEKRTLSAQLPRPLEAGEGPSEKPCAELVGLHHIEESTENDEESRDLDIWNDEATLFYLRKNDFPSEVKGMQNDDRKREMRRITKRATVYEFRDGTLLKKPSAGYGERIVPEPNDRIHVIREIHSEMGHLGVNKVTAMLAGRFYFRGMRDAVRAELRQCDACARRKADFKEDPELRPIPPLPSMQGLAMDVFGPLPLTPRGNKYVCIAIDRFTKWPEAKALPDKTCDSVTRFADELICRFAPTEIRSDHGSEFGEKFKKLLRHRGVKHVQGTPHRPQVNGSAEKTVSNILNGLRAVAASANPDTWDDHLPEILCGLRCAPQASTRRSPYMLLYGKEPVIPAQQKRLPVLHENHQEDHEETPPAHKVQQQLSSRAEELNTAARQALDNIHTAQEQQKKSYRRRRRLPDLQDPKTRMPIGSLVLMETPARSRKKLSSPAEGPYKVVSYDSSMTKATLMDAAGKQWWVSVNRLALYTPAVLLNQDDPDEPPTKRRL